MDSDASKESSTGRRDDPPRERMQRTEAKALNGTGDHDDAGTTGDLAAKHVTEEKEKEVEVEREVEEEEVEEAWGLVPVGLRNQDGENNCFLNSIVQVLTYLDL